MREERKVEGAEALAETVRAVIQSESDNFEDLLLLSGLRAPQDLQGADLAKCNLAEAQLSGADLAWTSFRGSNLRGAVLSHANMAHCDLREADLRGADLSGANLEEADLTGATMEGASLRGCNLRRANLSNSDFFRADLEKASFIETVFSMPPVMGQVLGSPLRPAGVARRPSKTVPVAQQRKQGSRYRKVLEQLIERDPLSGWGTSDQPRGAHDKHIYRAPRGTAKTPRVVLLAKGGIIYSLVVDDDSGALMMKADRQDRVEESEVKLMSKRDPARALGETIAKMARKRGIERVVLDWGVDSRAVSVREFEKGLRAQRLGLLNPKE